MQIATIALVCLVSAGAVAAAAPEKTSSSQIQLSQARSSQVQLAEAAQTQGRPLPGPQSQDVPNPPAGSPPYPPAPPPNGTGPLALPHLGAPAQPEPVQQPQKTSAPPANSGMKPPDQQKSRTDSARRPDPLRGRTCFNQSETREKISAHRLADPFRALRSGHIQGDALRARLCRWRQDEFVYEISVLRRDGRIAHVYMNASTGQAVQTPTDSDRR